MSALSPAARRLVPCFSEAVDALETAANAPITDHDRKAACADPQRRRPDGETSMNVLTFGVPYLNHRLAESRRARDGKAWQWQLWRAASVAATAASLGTLLGASLLTKDAYRHRSEGGVREDMILRRLAALNKETRLLTTQVSLFCAQDVGTLASLDACQKHAQGVLTGLREAVVHSPETRVKGSRQLRDGLQGAEAITQGLRTRLESHRAVQDARSADAGPDAAPKDAVAPEAAPKWHTAQPTLSTDPEPRSTAGAIGG